MYVYGRRKNTRIFNANLLGVVMRRDAASSNVVEDGTYKTHAAVHTLCMTERDDTYACA